MNQFSSGEQPPPTRCPMLALTAAAERVREWESAVSPPRALPLFMHAVSGSNLMTEFTPDSRNEQPACPSLLRPPLICGASFICLGEEQCSWPRAIRHHRKGTRKAHSHFQCRPTRHSPAHGNGQLHNSQHTQREGFRLSAHKYPSKEDLHFPLSSITCGYFVFTKSYFCYYCCYSIFFYIVVPVVLKQPLIRMFRGFCQQILITCNCY